MTLLNFIIWSPSPDIFTIPGTDHPVRWYGLLFASGFIIGQQIMNYIFQKEGKNVKHVDKLTMYVIIATIVGARLGHCLFYDPIYYLSNPLKLLAVWEGGLASHGGAIALFISLYLFGKKYGYKYMWVLDRVAIITILTGALIRMGNFMNSEIIGLPTNSANGIVFAWSLEEMIKNTDERVVSVEFEEGGEIESQEDGKVPLTVKVDYKRGVELSENQAMLFYESTLPRMIKRYNHINEHFAHPETKPTYKVYESRGVQYAEVALLGIPRHPAQLYESIACIVIFLIISHLWYHNRSQLKDGFIFGVFMTLLWAERFIDEFFKENQEAWEATIPLNMGQWLSIPMFIAGVIILIKTWGKREESKA